MCIFVSVFLYSLQIWVWFCFHFALSKTKHKLFLRYFCDHLAYFDRLFLCVFSSFSFVMFTYADVHVGVLVKTSMCVCLFVCSLVKLLLCLPCLFLLIIYAKSVCVWFFSIILFVNSKEVQIRGQNLLRLLFVSLFV